MKIKHNQDRRDTENINQYFFLYSYTIKKKWTEKLLFKGNIRNKLRIITQIFVSVAEKFDEMREKISEKSKLLKMK